MFGPNFGSVDWLTTIGNANYNALQVNLRHTSRRFEVQAGYTFGKSLDSSSSISEQPNPYNCRATYAPSAFDLKHDFDISYRYELPFGRLARNRLSDRSLLGTQPNGVNSYSASLPDVKPGALNLNPDPRNGRDYFNSRWAPPAPPPTGPGVENFDLALLKRVGLGESRSLQSRLE